MSECPRGELGFNVMLAYEEAVRETIEILGALGCAGQAFIEGPGYLVLQDPHKYQVLTGPPAPEGWECGTSWGSPWGRCRPRLSAARAFQGATRLAKAEDYAGQHRGAFSARLDGDTHVCDRKYFLQWPREWLTLLLKFRSPHSFHLLQGFSAGGFQLTRQYPLLGFAASLRAPAEMPGLVTLSPKNLLDRLGFPAACPTAALRVLAKMPAGEVGVWAIQRVKRILTCPRLIRRLYGLDRINRACVELLAEDLEEYVGEGFLTEVSRIEGQDESIDLLKNTLNMARRLGKRVPSIVSKEQLGGIYDRLHEWDCLSSAGVLEWTFTPPFPGIRRGPLILRPLSSAIEAIQEGRCQGVCVGEPFMLEELHGGRLAAYAMYAPQRATVALRKSWEVWSLDEIAMPYNAEQVAGETQDLVIAWLQEMQPGVDFTRPEKMESEAGRIPF